MTAYAPDVSTGVGASTSGVLASRPAAAAASGSFYFATDAYPDHGALFLSNGTAWTEASPKLQNLMGWFNAQHFGVTTYATRAAAVAAGDQSLSIISFLNTVGAAGGGVCYFPKGYYNVDKANSTQGGLYVKYDNISLQGDGVDQTVIFSSNTGNWGAQWNMLLAVQGAYKVAGTNVQSPSTANFIESRTIYNLLSGASFAEGASSITLNTAADAGNFTTGDLIYIRTGNCTSISATGYPKAEVNEVASANASTGVILLRRPLVRTYEQEYYNSGSNGVTEPLSFVPAPTGTAAPFGVSYATDCVIKNFAIRDMTLDHSSSQTYLLNVTHMQTILGFNVHNVKYIGMGSGFGANNLRDATIYGIREQCVIPSGAGATTVGAIFTTGRGSCDIVFSNCIAYAANVTSGLVLSEGTTGVIGNNMIVRSGKESASTNAPINVQTCSKDIVLRNAIIINSATTNSTAIAVDQNCTDGGYIDGMIVGGGDHANAIQVKGRKWVIGPGLNKTGATKIGGTNILPTEAPSPEYTISARFDLSKASFATTLNLGVVPVDHMVVAAHVDCSVVANPSGGTNDVTIGYSGLTNAFVTGTAEGLGTTGKKTPATGAQFERVQATERNPVTATYLGTGATSGKFTVVLQVVRVQTAP